ncbi:nicotinate-nicotinamide nucleotide adenylyltransferase [Acholeplasma sp. OttesenSCG-928-E16]|nr:nicotinate-nicotinamide nucleotide adenylyltransferase [Acholeplasma sp. OttesenSCG-928-E16]
MVIVFGGSFNPPTIAHKEILLKINNLFNPSKIIIVPVPNDYNKKDLVDVSLRIKMIRLMTDDLENVIVSDIEAKNKYRGTYAMLNNLSKYYKDLYFMMGSDQLEGIDSWINVHSLLDEYRFIILSRGNYKVGELINKYKKNFTFVDFESKVSSTKIRTDVRKNKDFTTKEVYNFIMANKLYIGDNDV